MQLIFRVQPVKCFFESFRTVLHSIFQSLVFLLLVTLVLLCLIVVFENHLLLVRLRLRLLDFFHHSVLVVVGGSELISVVVSGRIHSVVEVFIWKIHSVSSETCHFIILLI